MGQARQRKTSGATDPHEKIPKTYLWARRFTEALRERYDAACRGAKALHFPPPSEDGFVMAVITAGFAKMDEDVAKARAAREEPRIVRPDMVVGPLPGGQAQPIVIVDR